MDSDGGSSSNLLRFVCTACGWLNEYRTDALPTTAICRYCHAENQVTGSTREEPKTRQPDSPS